MVDPLQQHLTATAETTHQVDLMFPLSVVRGVVRYADGTPLVAPPEVFIRQTDATTNETRTFFKYRSSEDGSYVVLGVGAGAFTVIAEDSATGLSGTADGTLTQISTPVDVDVSLAAGGTVSGVVRDAQNAPIADAVVSLASTGLSIIRETQTNASGEYNFEWIPAGDLTVQAVAGGLMVSGVGSVAEGATLAIDLTMPAVGIVRGRAVAADGVTPMSSAPVTLWSRVHHGPAGTFNLSTYTNGAGDYEFTGVLAGPVSVVAGYQPDFAIGEGLITAGATTTLNVRAGGVVRPESLQYWDPTDLPDDWRSLSFDFDCYGNLLNAGIDSSEGSSPWFAGGAQLRVFGQFFACTAGARTGLQGRGFAMGDAWSGPIRTSRDVYAPANGGYIRYVESFTNTGTAPITFAVRLDSHIRSVPTPTQIDRANGTSVSGDRVAFVFGGSGGTRQPDTVTAEGLDVQARWAVTLAPGQTIGLMHFVVQTPSTDATNAQTGALVFLTDPNALAGLTPAQRGSIVNFSIP